VTAEGVFSYISRRSRCRDRWLAWTWSGRPFAGENRLRHISRSAVAFAVRLQMAHSIVNGPADGVYSGRDFW